MENYILFYLFYSNFIFFFPNCIFQIFFYILLWLKIYPSKASSNCSNCSISAGTKLNKIPNWVSGSNLGDKIGRIVKVGTRVSRCRSSFVIASFKYIDNFSIDPKIQNNLQHHFLNNFTLKITPALSWEYEYRASFVTIANHIYQKSITWVKSKILRPGWDVWRDSDVYISRHLA